MAGKLVPQSSGAGNAAFAQQGTVDWTALSRSSFTFSVEVMSRFSKAGVEMITCAMGQAMCSQFNVPPEGQKRVTDAISKLKAYSSYGQVLWFGFGVKHIVRSLCETKQGATCAALCACLRVSYSTEISARVLSVLCDQLLPSDGLSPALPQWAALVDVCSGALSPSKFPMMVDGFCRLAFTDRQRHSQCHRATTADALARALAELSKVSNGNVSSITFEGGYDCGWIAAVAEWLLCLRVKVLTEEGNCLYEQDSSQNNAFAQVIIIFNTHTHDPELAETKKLKVVNRTFHLPYNGISTLVVRSGDRGEVFGMGRSRWSTILEDTFGSAFKLLLSPNVIGSFAKFLLSGVKARPPSGSPSESPSGSTEDWLMWQDEMIHPWMRSFSSPAASGERAFFLAIADRLPELTPLLDALEHLERSVGSAAGPDRNPLWNACGCGDCGRNQHRDWTHPTPTIPITADICLCYVGMTLLNLIWLLAHIDVDETLQPASTGLLMLYEHVERQDDFNSESTNSITCESLWWVTNLNDIYRGTFELFTGLPSHKNLHKFGAASAICHGGICIWLSALENPLCDPPKQTALRVVPGKVSFRGRLYREIVHMEGEIMHMEEEMEGENLSSGVDLTMQRIAAHGTSRVSTLIVRETFDASQLEARIELSSGKTSNAFDTYLDDFGVERPRRLPSELNLHIRNLYGTLHTRIGHATCDDNLGRARSQGLPKPDLTTWERPCRRLALMLEAAAPPKRFYNYPEAGEWVLVVRDSVHEAPLLRVFRGDFSLLYYLVSLSFADMGAVSHLVYFDGCIRCLAFKFAVRKYYVPFKRKPRTCKIEIHTITDNECTYWSGILAGATSEWEAWSQ